MLASVSTSSTSPSRPIPHAADRRAHHRYSVWFPVQLDGEELGLAVAISKDASAKGLLLEANGSFVVGAPVRLTFRVSPDHAPQQIDATIVRAHENRAGVWPFRLAVEFDDAMVHLDASLRRESKRQGDPPG